MMFGFTITKVPGLELWTIHRGGRDLAYINRMDPRAPRTVFLETGVKVYHA